MKYFISQLTAGAYVIAIEDTHTWDVVSYTNLYVLQRTGQTILIDAGMTEYQTAIIPALAEIGITPDMVTHVLLTHGHHDHVAGAALFSNAKKFVHSADLPMIAPPLAAQFSPFMPLIGDFAYAAEGLEGLGIVLVNTHSPGSVAIFDHMTKALFVGDFFCYFGEALPGGELVTDSEYVKRGSCDYVAGQSAAGGDDFDKFMLGLGRLLNFQPEFFCTGHGVVVRRDIQTFLKDMWRNGRQPCRDN
jgi:glyoxylase-like metal-dependent hydrolase (beta-lactamase superfamily II)